MAEGSPDGEAMRAYAAAQQRLDHGGGYRWRDDVLTVLRGLGFPPEQAERPLATFSGGELTRASLARALATRPDLLLLDEPTNHLDIPSLEWLESYLVGLDAAVVLVAHDRWFLEAVGTSVLELEAGKGRFFSGPWHAWRTEQAARQIALGKAIERQQAEIARMERFVERFRYKATKAKQAQSRVKKIEKVKAEAVSFDPSDTPQPALRLQGARARRALRAEGPGRPHRGPRPGADRRRGTARRARRAHRPRRPERRRQDHADRDARRDARARRRQGQPGPQRPRRVPLPARRERSGGGDGARRGGARDGPDRPEGPGPARRVPLLGLRRDEAAQRHLGWRAAAALARDPRQLGRQRADPRRADQPSRRREPRGPRGRPARLPGRCHPRLPRPGPARGRREPHAGRRRRRAAKPSRRLGHLPARGRRAPRGRVRGGRPPPTASPRRARRRRRATGRRSRRRRTRCARSASSRRRSSAAEASLRELEEELADPEAWSSPGRSQRAGERHKAAKAELDRLYAEWEQAQQKIAR